VAKRGKQPRAKKQPVEVEIACNGYLAHPFEIYTFVFPIYLYLCHMERFGGRSRGVLRAASEEQPHSYEKNRRFLTEPAQGSHAGDVLEVSIAPIWGGFSQRFGHPGIGRGSSDSDMDYPSCLEFDDEERKGRSKEEIAYLQESAGPDSCCMMVQKGSPSLSSWH